MEEEASAISLETHIAKALFCFPFSPFYLYLSNEKEKTISSEGRNNWLDPNKEPMNPKFS